MFLAVLSMPGIVGLITRIVMIAVPAALLFGTYIAIQLLPANGYAWLVALFLVKFCATVYLFFKARVSWGLTSFVSTFIVWVLMLGTSGYLQTEGVLLGSERSFRWAQTIDRLHGADQKSPLWAMVPDPTKQLVQQTRVSPAAFGGVRGFGYEEIGNNLIIRHLKISPAQNFNDYVSRVKQGDGDWIYFYGDCVIWRRCRGLSAAEIEKKYHVDIEGYMHARFVQAGARESDLTGWEGMQAACKADELCRIFFKTTQMSAKWSPGYRPLGQTAAIKH